MLSDIFAGSTELNKVVARPVEQVEVIFR